MYQNTGYRKTKKLLNSLAARATLGYRKTIAEKLRMGDNLELVVVARALYLTNINSHKTTSADHAQNTQTSPPHTKHKAQANKNPVT